MTILKIDYQSQKPLFIWSNFCQVLKVRFLLRMNISSVSWTSITRGFPDSANGTEEVEEDDAPGVDALSLSACLMTGLGLGRGRGGCIVAITYLWLKAGNCPWELTIFAKVINISRDIINPH